MVECPAFQNVRKSYFAFLFSAFFHFLISYQMNLEWTFAYCFLLPVGTYWRLTKNYFCALTPNFVCFLLFYTSYRLLTFCFSFETFLVIIFYSFILYPIWKFLPFWSATWVLFHCRLSFLNFFYILTQTPLSSLSILFPTSYLPSHQKACPESKAGGNFWEYVQMIKIFLFSYFSRLFLFLILLLSLFDSFLL